MIILIAIAIFEAILLAGTAWSAIRRPSSRRLVIPRRAEDMPHAL